MTRIQSATLLALALVAPVTAQTYKVVPAQYTTTEGPSSSAYPFAYLRADASMLWSRYRFMGLGEGQRVKVESPVGPVWVERRHLAPLHRQISDREDLADGKPPHVP